MLREEIVSMDSFVDTYVNINEFKDIMLDIGSDTFYFAAAIACIEGIIKINKDHLTFLGMYKIKLNNNYKFLGLYNFLKNNTKYYEYIVNYFNVWHSNKNELFSYDEYNKMDLIKNYYELECQLIEERELAKFSENDKILDAYSFFCNNLTTFSSSKVSC